MGMPDQESAKTWGGRLLVDRDGTPIGVCTQIFVDDATGLPEWAQADLNGAPAVVPLVDAAESGDRVRVAVSRDDVSGAPAVDDLGHISEAEEERLYRHYGVTFSRDASDTLLPADGPVDQPVVPAVVGESSSTAPPAELTDVVPEQGRRGPLPAFVAGVVGVVGAVAAAIFWWRVRHQAPPTRTELLAARARAASLTLGSRRDQLATSAAPLLRNGRRLSGVAARRAAVQARTAADSAAVRARAAARQAAAAAAAARTIRLQRVGSAPEPQPTSGWGARGGLVRAALQTLGGAAAGYTVGRHSGTERAEGVARVPSRMAETFRAGNARLSQGAGRVATRVRRSGTDGSTVPADEA